MNSLLDDKDEDIEDHHHGRKDREITLGTTVVLGIFFALAVSLSVAFGFGYSVGAKHAAASSAAAETNPSTTFGGFKPPSGKIATDLAKAPAAATVSVPLTAVPAPLPKAPSRPAPDPSLAAEAPVAEAPTRPQPVAAPPRAPAPIPVTAATPAPAGQMMVQIAAVSHQEDADLLVSTLKRRSYAVAVHHEPQDQLLHVQVGPFSTRKDADAMRTRLQADGFNAIVKGPAN